MGQVIERIILDKPRTDVTPEQLATTKFYELEEFHALM